MHAHLQQVASLVDLLDVFVGEDAAGSLQLALSLSGSSGDDGFMQTGHRKQTVMHLSAVNSHKIFTHKALVTIKAYV